MATASIVALLWQLVAVMANHPLLPGLPSIARAMVSGFGDSLAVHAGASLARVLCALVVSSAIGWPLGILLGTNRAAGRFLSPLVYMLYPVPKVVFVPLIMLWFGIGNAPKVFLICLVLVTQMTVLVRDSAAAIPAVHIASLRSLGAGRTALCRFVFIPATLPAALTAIRQSIGTGFAVLYIAELIGTVHGLGHYIRLNGSVLFDYPAMYAGIAVMAALGLALFIAVDKLQRILCPHLHLAQD